LSIEISIVFSSNEEYRPQQELAVATEEKHLLVGSREQRNNE